MMVFFMWGIVGVNKCMVFVVFWFGLIGFYVWIVEFIVGCVGCLLNLYFKEFGYGVVCNEFWVLFRD